MLAKAKANSRGERRGGHVRWTKTSPNERSRARCRRSHGSRRTAYPCAGDARPASAPQSPAERSAALGPELRVILPRLERVPAPRGAIWAPSANLLVYVLTVHPVAASRRRGLGRDLPVAAEGPSVCHRAPR